LSVERKEYGDMALKDDVQLVATIGAILLTRHNHPLENSIKDVLSIAVKLLDAAEKGVSAPALPVQLQFPDGTTLTVPAGSPWPFDPVHGGQAQPPTPTL
jgi:hypothetical protein